MEYMEPTPAAPLTTTTCSSQSPFPNSLNSSPSPPLPQPPAAEVPEGRRSDAVSSMVYEASARIRDPVYGCAGTICQLQRQVDELQAELAKAQAEVVNMQLQQANAGALLCMEMEMGLSSPHPNSQQSQSVFDDDTFVTGHGRPSFMEDDDDNNLGALWEPL
ncbi:hypothetical protein V6N11_034230 [Hibiscus sabdariffa]